MTKGVQVFKHTDVPKNSGEFFRLICLTGENKGQAYQFISNRIVMGRSENADIRVMDIKSSREHAEITKLGPDYILTDLGSQNGVLINDLKVSQHKLREGDKVIIGKTVYKFVKIIVNDSQLNNSEDKFETDVLKLEKPDEGKKGKNPVILIILVIGVIYFIFGGEKKNIENNKRVTNEYKLNEVVDEFSSAEVKRKLAEDKVTKKKMNDIFQRGLREYREGNYFRALSEFDLALMLNSKDPLADYYKKKTKEALDKEIKDQFLKGKRDIDSLKFQSAIVSYCSIIRLLYNYPEDERYRDADANLRDLEGKLGMEPNEIKCIKE